MKHKRSAKLHPVHHEQMIADAQTFCRGLNDLASKLSPAGDDYRVLSELNASVLAAVQSVTGAPAPWIAPALASSYPDSKPAHE